MKLLLTFVFLLIAGSARADELTAGELFSFCLSSDNTKSAACSFYILGASTGIRRGDGMYMGPDGQWMERKKTIVCNADPMSSSEMVSLVMNQLSLAFKSNPEHKKLAADLAIAIIMSQKFPCPS